MYERLALGFGLQVRLRIALDGLVEMARHVEKSGRPITKDPVLRQKLAQLWIETESLKYTGARAITKLLRGELPGPEASAGKMVWVDVAPAPSRTGYGDRGAVLAARRGAPSGRSRAASGSIRSCDHGPTRSKGGTAEIQKNIIGERVLGLPKG